MIILRGLVRARTMRKEYVAEHWNSNIEISTENWKFQLVPKISTYTKLGRYKKYYLGRIT